MHRKFIALIIATAVAITGLSSVPALADDRDAGRIFAGLAALAILGAVIESNRDNNKPTVSQSAQPRYSHRPTYQHVTPRHLPQHVSRYDLPGKCLRNHGLHGGPKRLLGLQCLQENYRFTNALPYACRLQFDNRYLSRTGYEPLCLREHGYRIVRN